MQSVGVARCQSCQSIVNLNWSACVVCGKSIDDLERCEVHGESVREECQSVPLGQDVKAGNTIAWDSPLLGHLTGEVLAVYENGNLEVFHPCTEQLARIPLVWVRQKG